eukprot:1160098-Pelagomonas_calceolata.AAC.1
MRDSITLKIGPRGHDKCVHDTHRNKHKHTGEEAHRNECVGIVTDGMHRQRTCARILVHATHSAMKGCKQI